jgi:nucleotide-binding universal stress UspA family protein
MERILLATDGSDYARAAAEYAIDLAAEEGAVLDAICVVDRRRFADTALSSAELAAIKGADDAALSVSAVREMAAAKGVEVRGDTRHGVPHEVILAYADEVDADRILVGEHGDHDHHFSGVGRELREHADREVRVVRPEPA